MVATAVKSEAGKSTTPEGDMIVAEGIDKVYQARNGDPIIALDRINLAIKKNEFVTLVGPSGCGKSTLLKMIAALIDPSGGKLILNGRPLLGPSRDVGIVFQDPVLLPQDSFRSSRACRIERV